jgi:hypothetical protein
LRNVRIVLLGMLLLLLAWGGSGGIAYGVVHLTGGGNTGAQGPVGQQGPAGPPGPAGSDLAQAMVKRMAALWSAQTVSSVNGGAFVSFSNSQVVACVNYILNGEGGFQSCPGFTHR